MSWYRYNIEEIVGTEKYLAMIEQVFKVKHADKQWKYCVLEPHQIEFHGNDIAIKGPDAKSDVVEKSRNTSFTISTAIRLLTGNYTYRDEVVPLVRINEQKVKELIAEIKSIIKHMTPIKLPNGDLWPFDPNQVDMNNVLEIRFKDRDVVLRGYPASASAAENIRGLRITRGFIDESNFMREYKTIYIAMRDAAAGTARDGKKYFQLTIGSTLKGLTTPFKLWLDNIKKLNLPIIRILSWPVFDPALFESGKSILEQPKLIPIVHWHDLQDLEYKRLEDLNTFLEEYMAVCIPDEMKFYPLGKILELYDPKMRNLDVPIDKNAIYYMGVDPAGEGNDFFSVSIFEETPDFMIQRKLYYEKNTDLEDMQRFIGALINVWNPIKCRIDANAIGYQLGQSLKKRYPEQVELLRGRVSVKGGLGLRISINEFMHTNQKKLISLSKVKYLNDELQANHFTGWDYSFNCEHTKEYGHGDTTISNALALLPLKWKMGDREGSGAAVARTSKVLKEKEDYQKMDMIDRINYYKRQKTSRLHRR